jgi:hypothetical protein
MLVIAGAGNYLTCAVVDGALLAVDDSQEDDNEWRPGVPPCHCRMMRNSSVWDKTFNLGNGSCAKVDRVSHNISKTSLVGYFRDWFYSLSNVNSLEGLGGRPQKIPLMKSSSLYRILIRKRDYLRLK